MYGVHNVDGSNWHSYVYGLPSGRLETAVVPSGLTLCGGFDAKFSEEDFEVLIICR